MCTPVRDVGEEDDFGNGVFDECFGAHDETFGTFDTFDSDVRGSHASRTNTNPLNANGDGKYYRFAHNTRAVRSNFVHFQLRNLVWATSKNDAYVMSENRVVHWNAATRRATTALDLDGGGGGGLTNHGRRDDETRDDARDDGARSARGEAFFDDDDFFSENETSDETSDGRLRDPGSARGDGGGGSFALSGNFPRIQVSTTCARDSLVAAGGFAGELVVLDVDTGVSASTRVTRDDNGITNAVDFFSTPGGAEALVCSNNDKATRWYDIATMKCVARHEYPWAVNYTAVGRDGTLAAVVGDTKEAWVVDTRSGKLVQTCEGHLDFSFAAAWHPDGVRFATGNRTPPRASGTYGTPVRASLCYEGRWAPCARCGFPPTERSSRRRSRRISCTSTTSTPGSLKSKRWTTSGKPRVFLSRPAARRSSWASRI